MNNYFMGLDVSKGYVDITIVDENGNIAGTLNRLFDDYTGHKLLLDYLDNLKKQKNTVIYAALEHTGGYEVHWLKLLQENAGLKDTTFIINGYRIKHFQKAINYKNKTDAVSSHVIAQFIRTNFRELNIAKQSNYYHYKKHYYYLFELEKEQTQYINRLRSLLYESYPEFLTVMPNKFSPTILNLLIKYPSSKSFLAAKDSQIFKIKYLRKKMIADLQDICKKSILVKNKDDEAIEKQNIQNIASKVLGLEHEINEGFERLNHIVDQHQLELLCTIPGISKTSAIGLLLIIDDIKNFDNPKKLAAYFGVHPVQFDSGDVQKSKMSKQGNPFSRAILFNSCYQMFRSESPFHEHIKHQALLLQDNNMKAIGKCMHLMCRIVWALLTYNTPFDMEKFKKDRSGKQKSKNHQKIDFNVDNINSSDDIKAPISKKTKRIIDTLIEKREPQVSEETKTGSSRQFPTNTNIKNDENCQDFT